MTEGDAIKKYAAQAVDKQEKIISSRQIANPLIKEYNLVKTAGKL
ncbi:hypothetical protein ACGP04_15320 [Piscirickettsia salmonis]